MINLKYRKNKENQLMINVIKLKNGYKIFKTNQLKH